MGIYRAARPAARRMRGGHPQPLCWVNNQRAPKGPGANSTNPPAPPSPPPAAGRPARPPARGGGAARRGAAGICGRYLCAPSTFFELLGTVRFKELRLQKPIAGWREQIWQITVTLCRLLPYYFFACTCSKRGEWWRAPRTMAGGALSAWRAVQRRAGAPCCGGFGGRRQGLAQGEAGSDTGRAMDSGFCAGWSPASSGGRR